MEMSFILLDIPSGVVTFASAILAAFVLVIVTLAGIGFRLLYSTHGQVSELKSGVTDLQAADLPGRVSALEPQVSLILDFIRNGQLSNLPGVHAPGNPMAQDRWDELAGKLHREEITEEEAREFLAALLERREQAILERDTATLVILSAGITFAKWRLGETEWQLREREKELREQG